jgi:hypothetical protein
MEAVAVAEAASTWVVIKGTVVDGNEDDTLPGASRGRYSS